MHFNPSLLLYFNPYLLLHFNPYLLLHFNPSLPPPPPPHSEVWLGEYKSAKVAIKMLKDIKDAKATKQFLAEASIMT